MPFNKPCESNARSAQEAGTPDLSYLRSVSNGNENFIADMVATMKDSLPKSVNEILDAAAKNDYPKLAKALHKISPSLPMMGLDELKAELVLIQGDLKNKSNSKSKTKQIQSEVNLDELFNDF